MGGHDHGMRIKELIGRMSTEEKLPAGVFTVETGGIHIHIGTSSQTRARQTLEVTWPEIAGTDARTRSQRSFTPSRLEKQ
jgi:hypothetical protein